MKSFLAGAVALSLAFSATVAPAFADTSGFRTAAPQTFSSQDLQNYGLNADAAQRAVQLQAQGYQIKVLTPAEAQRYQAGVTDSQWIWLGILAGVIVIAVAVSN